MMEWYRDIRFSIFDHVLFDTAWVGDVEAVTEIYLPKAVRMHHTWNMYSHYPNLQAVYAHEHSEFYETHDGALYRKKTGELVYVPRGKNTLHIPQTAQRIGYLALAHHELQTVTLDPDNPYFSMINGILYDKKMETLYFAPPTLGTLKILPSVKRIDRAMVARGLPEIDVDPANPHLVKIGQVVFDANGDIVYFPRFLPCLHIPANTKTVNLGVADAQVSAVTVDPENPYHCAYGNVVCSKDRTKLTYVPSMVTEIVLPNELEVLEKEQFSAYKHLTSISVSLKTRFTAKAFSNMGRTVIITLRCGAGRSITVTNEDPKALACFIHYLRGFDPEIKAGTEQFYVDVLRLGLDPSPAFLRAMKVSVWQIVRKLIECDDVQRMEVLLNDGTIIGKKHMGRLLRHAKIHGSDAMQTMVQRFQ